VIQLIKDELKFLNKMYPKGSRIKLIYMNDPYALPSGIKGTVDFIDDEGQIHVKWDNGNLLALIHGVDKFEKIYEKNINYER